MFLFRLRHIISIVIFFVTGADLFVELNKKAAGKKGLCDLANFAQHEAKVVDR